MGEEPLLVIDGVHKEYPDGTRAVFEVSLSVSAGEFVSVVGPSGCGKTTLLRIGAGLEPVSGGAVTRSTDELAFVFQHPTLMPWRTVRRNVELIAELRGFSRRLRRERAIAALAEVGLLEFVDHHPRALSGGMQMRVALAQALVLEPALFFLDEPFGALDELTRSGLGEDLHTLHRHQRFSVLFAERGGGGRDRTRT